MAAYQLTLTASIIRTSDGASIPADLANADYQTFLAWEAAGNTPDPAPVPTPSTQIQAADFLNRFTPTEQAAVQQLAITNGQIALGLTLGLARGYIELDPVKGPLLRPWMAALVGAGAITAARSAVILTP